MAKELPYFKFEPAEYLTKDISFCSLSAQGLFINICSYYWQRNCELTKDQLLRRLNNEKELNELVKEGAIDLIGNDISIKFLDLQLQEVEMKSKTNKANGSKGGRPKKNPTETELKPNLNPIETEDVTESKGIREDKIREDKIREQNNINSRKLKFAESLEKFLDIYPKEMNKDFYENTKFKQEMQDTWSLDRRLKTWNKNNFNKNSNNGQQVTEIGESIRQINSNK